ncbi:MAG: MbtH family protein [Methylobacterium sp.]
MVFDRDDIAFTVVINDEEQYAIWPEFKPVPAGWRQVGVSGDKAACLQHIEEVWTDMRPRSLREAMDGPAA